MPSFRTALFERTADLARSAPDPRGTAGVAPEPLPSRRSLLGFAGSLAAAGLGGAAVVGADLTRPARAGAATAPGQLFGSDRLLHLLRRTSFGLNPGTVSAARAQGLGPWLNAQLAPASVPDPIDGAIASGLPRLGWSTQQVRAAYPTGSADVLNDLLASTVARAIWSTRQLQEVMVDFWSNHLNVAACDGDLWDTRHLLDPVIRSHTLTDFASLLKATIMSPAMLRYLNADQSNRYGINENLGRELLELHTVGIDAGYTQDDVVASARILTGATIAPDGTYQYRPDLHWTGPVTVLGFSSTNRTAANGQALLTSYLTYLARHPSTARHLATKLATRFVSDVPPTSLVDTLAATYLRSGTSIVPVLRALFASQEFAASVGQKVRRPYEDVYATVRALDLDPSGTTADTWNTVVGICRNIGHVPLYRSTPDGYPDTADAYATAGAALGRLNVHQLTPFGVFPAIPAPAAYVAGSPTTLGAAVDTLAQRFLTGPLAASHRATVLAFAGGTAATDVRARSWRSLELQIVPLLLDSPYFTSR